MLEARGVHKQYGGVVALADVDLHVRAGSVHALVGENGAGKSTLVKILAGAVAPDQGELRLDDRAVKFATTAHAAAQGVAVVSQELSLFPDLDVLANVFPMREPRRGALVARGEMAAQAQPILRSLGLDIEPRTPVERLSLEQRQLVEIARALVARPRVLILDEPTSALQAHETDRLHALLSELRARRVAVVYVSHVLEDVLSLCDEITVLRDGRCVMAAEPTSDLPMDRIVRAMLGDKVTDMTAPPGEAPQRRVQHEGALRFEAVSVPGALQSVSFEAPAGAIVGVAGLAGSGHRTALALAAGLERPSAGRVRLPDGADVGSNFRAAVRQGVALVSGDRVRFGVMPDKPVWDNIAQVHAGALGRDGHILRTRRLRARAHDHVTRLGIKTSSVNDEVGWLSGGNQQKVVFAKWLQASPSVYLLDDPTRGIDVGAKHEIYGLMRELATDGKIQLLVSTDPGELARVCDFVVVFHAGQVCAELAPPDLDAHSILEAMNAGAPQSAAASTLDPPPSTNPGARATEA